MLSQHLRWSWWFTWRHDKDPYAWEVWIPTHFAFLRVRSSTCLFQTGVPEWHSFTSPSCWTSFSLLLCIIPDFWCTDGHTPWSLPNRGLHSCLLVPWQKESHVPRWHRWLITELNTSSIPWYRSAIRAQIWCKRKQNFPRRLWECLLGFHSWVPVLSPQVHVS